MFVDAADTLSLFDTATMGVYRTTPDGRILHVNRGLLDMLEFPDLGTIQSVRATDLYVDPRDRRLWQEALEREGCVSGYETQMRRWNGGTIWVRETAHIVFDQENGIRYYEGSIEDITASRGRHSPDDDASVTAEARERMRTFEMQVLYELSQQINYTVSYDHLFRVVSQHLFRVVAYDVAALLLAAGDTRQLFLRPVRNCSPQVQQQVEETLLGALSAMREETDVQPAVTTRVVEQAALDEYTLPVTRLGSSLHVPLIVDHGREVVGILLVGAKREDAFSEEQVRVLYSIASQTAASIDRMRALVAAEHRRVENLVENMPAGVLMIDHEQRLVLANRIGREYLATLTEASIGDVIHTLADRPVTEFLCHGTSERPEPQVVEIAAGSTYDVVARPLESDQDDGGWVVVVRDISAERDMQEKVRQQDRLAAVGQLAAGIAHDFNNLLSGVVGFAELLEIRDDIPESARDWLHTIREQGLRAAELIRQILDFSRKSILQKRPLDLVPLLKETHKLLQRTIPESITVLLDVASGDYVIEADITQLQQVITNLALNSRDAMPRGGELKLSLSRLTVRADSAPPLPEMTCGEWVRLQITDTGSGMDAAVAAHVFEPFFTTKGPGRGTGLGLSQVYGIIKQHDGHIGLDTAPGRGSTFTIYLPGHAVARPDCNLPSRADIPRGAGETLLVVEDEPYMLRVAREILETLDYQVLTAADGLEALDVYDRHSAEIALVITDMVMPRMGGAALVEALRDRDSEVRVVVASGYPLGEDSQELLSGGLVHVLPKPFNVMHLAETVQHSLRGEPPTPRC